MRPKTDQPHPLFKLKDGRRLVLASASPRRSALLASLGLEFAVHPARGEEPVPFAMEEPDSYVLRAATFKARQVFADLADDNCIILAADTAIGIDNMILGKPANQARALDMLVMLNGRAHAVYTGFCLICADNGQIATRSQTVCTKVQFASWPRSMLQAYASLDEPLDKAGAYAIQGAGAFLVQGIQGSWSNVAGLPISQLLAAMLAAPPLIC